VQNYFKYVLLCRGYPHTTLAQLQHFGMLDDCIADFADFGIRNFADAALFCTCGKTLDTTQRISPMRSLKAGMIG